MGLADRSLPVKGVVRSVNRLRPDANGNVSIVSGTPSDGDTIIYNSTTNVYEVAPRGIDLDATKVAELAPDDAAIWIPANAADVTFSADPADRTVVLEATEAWEANSVQEVSVWFEAGQFHMLYTGGWDSAALGYAKADHPEGPWTKHPQNPVLGSGQGGEPGSAKCSFHFVDTDGEHYTYYANPYAGSGTNDLFVATGKPPTLVKHGVALSHTATAVAIQNLCVVNDGGTYRMIFESHSTTGAFWKLGYATATDPLGPFTIQQFPLTDLQHGSGTASGPWLSRQADGTWTLYYHGTTSGLLPTDIYRAFSSDLLSWTQDATVLVDRELNPPEGDQAADPHYLVCDFGAFLFWEGVDNTAQTSSIVVTRALGLGPPKWFDGDSWENINEAVAAQPDLNGAKVAQNAPDDAVVWLPAPGTDFTVSTAAADRQVIIAPTETWEAGVVQEASPWIHGGKFHMLYTGGWLSSAIGYASADHPLGPWTKHPVPVIGAGAGGMVDPTAHHNAYVEGDTVYAYYPDAIDGGNLKVATASVDDPTEFTTQGTALATGGTILGIVNTSLLKRGEGDYVLMFEAHASSGPQWQIGYATGASPLGPFTVQTFPLSTLSRGDSTAMFGGPMISREDDGTYVLVYHATASGVLPTRIYRATSPDLTTWTQDAGVLVDMVLDPPETDQVADGFYLVCDFGAFMLWEGMDNVTPAGSILASQVAHGDPRWFDGTDWQTTWPGEVTQAELDAVQAEIDGLGVTHSEVLMSDDGTLTPLTTNAGDDWLYGLVSV